MGQNGIQSGNKEIMQVTQLKKKEWTEVLMRLLLMCEQDLKVLVKSNSTTRGRS